MTLADLRERPLLAMEASGASVTILKERMEKLRMNKKSFEIFLSTSVYFHIWLVCIVAAPLLCTGSELLEEAEARVHCSQFGLSGICGDLASFSTTSLLLYL